MQRFLWNICGDKVIKTKEIREYNIKEVKEGNYRAVAFGFFGGGVDLFEGTQEECKSFIENLTSPEKKGGENEWGTL